MQKTFAFLRCLDTKCIFLMYGFIVRCQLQKINSKFWLSPYENERQYMTVSFMFHLCTFSFDAFPSCPGLEAPIYILHELIIIWKSVLWCTLLADRDSLILDGSIFSHRVQGTHFYSRITDNFPSYSFYTRRLSTIQNPTSVV